MLYTMPRQSKNKSINTHLKNPSTESKVHKSFLAAGVMVLILISIGCVEFSPDGRLSWSDTTPAYHPRAYYQL